jgi:16S rRNA (guanine527-N7)-methyltransferase
MLFICNYKLQKIDHIYMTIHFEEQFAALKSAIGTENVSRETFSTLKEFSELLLKWNSKINLVSKKISEEELWQRHILDSAQLLQYILKPKSSIIDLGSGAGFPALVLAIIAGHKITVIESDQRKCAFMQEASTKFKLGVTIINSRIEDITSLECDLITSRALASLKKLLEYSESILQKETFMLFLKGQNVVEEIKEASTSWEIDYKIFPDAFNKDGVVLKISNARRL